MALALGGLASARAFADPWYCAFTIGAQGFEDEEAGPEPGSGGTQPGGTHEPEGGPGILALPIEELVTQTNQTATTIPLLRNITTDTKKHAIIISSTLIASVHGMVAWSRSVTR